ncbi:MAG: hypothetical protein GC162_02595 [Planctomycetes bacterium]|nr:hypothetical protein [Planctomycetota bacterium]
MSEFVLIIPLIVVILALLFYFGHLEVRAMHTSEMARYDVWRSVAGAPGPHQDDDNGNTLLNQAFMGNRASTINDDGDDYDNYFPDDPYQEMIADARAVSSGAGDVMDAFLYRPGGNHRNARGRRETFHVLHQDTNDMWKRITSIAHRPIDNPEMTPLTRRQTRIGNDWSYTNDWRAAADRWEDTWGGNPNHLRAVRDVYFADFDAMLDGIDGSHDPEYSDQGGGPEVPAGDRLAGQMRGLYLFRPGYAGPTVP